MESQPIPPAAPLYRGTLIGFALGALALQLAVITRYGWFRDEFYYMACANHLAWGYVDQPPLSIAILWLVRHTLGDSLLAVRLLPALAGAAVVYLCGSLAAALGGGRFAQTVACLAALLAPVYLGTAHFFSMNVFDLLLWTIAIHVLVRIVRDRGSGGSGTRDWAKLGLVLGLGLLNKISMLWLGFGLAVGLALTPQRRALLTPWPYVAAAIAAVTLLPHALWQVANDWPTLEFMRNATTRKMVEVGRVDFVLRQLLEVGPGNAVVWIPGLVFALLARSGRPWRILGLIYLAVALLLMAGGRSRASYLAAAYPPLLALGGVAWERLTAERPWRRLRAPALALLVLIPGLVPIPFALPLLPVESFIRYQAALHMAPATEENLRVGPLPQHYADMFGWPEMVAEVAKAYERLSPEEKKHALVFGQNYGEAGCVDVLGRRLGLPRAVSGHNNYWLWGPGDWDGSVLIIIGGDAEGNAVWFEQLERVGTIDSPYAMPYERGLGVFIGRRLRMPPREAWGQLKMYI